MRRGREAFAKKDWTRGGPNKPQGSSLSRGTLHPPGLFYGGCKISQNAGYAGPAGRKAAEVISKYLISDMYAKAVQGMPVEQAVKSTHDELVNIYA